MKTRALSLTVILVLFFVSGAHAAEDSTYAKIDRSLKIFGEIFHQISMYYVDDIDPYEFVHAGIDGMLDYLDPYTVYIDEKNGDEVDLLTTGIYGGLGITVGTVDSMLTIIGITEGYTADKAGLRIGDKIYKIDSTVVLHFESGGLQSYTRGKPGTKVKMYILRDGLNDTLGFDLTRQEITIKNVSYSGILDNGVGYIRLERFSRSAALEVRSALEELREKAKPGSLKGLILDLRDNPGGLLEAAVSISEIFVPTNSVIVSTRGRTAESERKYISRNKPMEGNLPLAVLINGGSASASEIVAGAIQDLDRGILVGEHSFGKGLVQTINSLPFNGNLKLTTAKYYTPSGRCIQKIDYAKRRRGIFKVVPDTSQLYSTAHGRKVYESNGIDPDTLISPRTSSSFVAELLDGNVLFKFANIYAAQHNSLPEHFVVTKDIIHQFGEYLKNHNFFTPHSALKKLAELKEVLHNEEYPDNVLQKVQKLEDIFLNEQLRELERNEEMVSSLLQKEIYARFYPKSKVIGATLNTDIQVQTAASVLQDKSVYHAKLHDRFAPSEE